MCVKPKMKNEAEHNEFITLAVKKLSGEASADELHQLHSLIDAKAENRRLFEELEETWISSEKARGITVTEIDEEWQRLEKAMQPAISVATFPAWLKLAASIALLVSVSLLIFQLSRNDQETLVAEGKIITKTLSDGSLITLKAGTEMKYNPGFSEDRREILLDGEAFFEVARDIERPFIVHTHSIVVTVLGTSFNVKADESETAEVVVVDGLVSVKFGGKEVTLNPTEKAVAVIASENLSRTKNEDPNFLSWKTMQFHFNNTPLKQVVADLNHAFQSAIYVDENLQNCPVTVSFDGQKLESILRVLEATLNLSIKEQGNQKLLTGPGC